MVLVVRTGLEKQVRSCFPLPLKCTISTMLGLKKCGFGDVGFDVLEVVWFQLYGLDLRFLFGF